MGDKGTITQIPRVRKSHPMKKVVRVQCFVRGVFVGNRSRVSSKHLSSLIFRSTVFDSSGGQKGVALQLQDARVGVGSTKDFDRCWEWLRYNR
ncbi:hypothetical protein TNCV_293821 [Trichonephila clavipes]|nr:hypothetical protein TNCV_293821 [Trichonephila clavipes]